MNYSYKGYANTDYNNICVAMCMFNPIGYKNILKNIQTVIGEFKKTNIPFYIIELLYPSQQKSVPEANVVVRGLTAFFSKENLWNVLEKHIPNKYEKIVFLDNDILFTDHNWINKIAQKLTWYKAVHVSEYLYRDIHCDHIYDPICNNIDDLNQTTSMKQSIVKGIKHYTNLDPSLFHPGAHVAIDRNFFHQIGGFFDRCPVTIGDVLFWSSFIPDFKRYAAGFLVSPNFKKERDEYFAHKKQILNLCDPSKDIDYLENNISLHLYHGSPKYRHYNAQDRFIPGPYKLWYNKDGVLEIEITHPIIKDMRSYFLARNEDSL